MPRTVRIIARLDIKGPNVIKGIQFDGHRVVGAPQTLAEIYYLEGADELFFQDTVASLYRRNSLLDIIRETARRVFIPMTVAGGIRSIEQIREILRAGADKVAINTAAVENPGLIQEAVRRFGSQCIVASLEVFRQPDDRLEIWTDYGRERTSIDAVQWARKVVDLGVGEILLTSIAREGTGRGYDLDLIRRLATELPIPVIASGGAGSAGDLARAVTEGKADAVAAASIFHYYYMKPPAGSTIGNRYHLRFGKQIDVGNIDFLQSGYGGYRAVPVTPCSLPEAKQAVRAAGIPIRPSTDEGRRS
jgi:cyclase